MAHRPRPAYLGLRGWVHTDHGDIGVYDGRKADMDLAGGRWQTVCETHGTIISHATLKLARAFAATPEDWCDLSPLPLLGILSTPEMFVARFKNTSGRYLVTSEGGAYSGQRILDSRQLRHGNLPDRRTGLWLNEMTRTFSISELLSIRHAPRVVGA